MSSPFYLYNTFSRSKEQFIINDDFIKMYVCGPTVYNYVHIGNFRTFIMTDLLRRTLRFLGYKLRHVMNITDVGHLSDDGEDRMLKSSREQNTTAWQIADYYTKIFLEDAARLNIEQADVICKATDHISDMVDMITILERKGYAYSAGGNIYFDVSKFPDYGKMARLTFQEERARVEADSEKRNPHDFVLWFTRSKFDNHAMLWDSPWGKGYPGWHIECSAMSRAYLGDQLDIHCGGTDLIPIHHSNEIAQSEAVGLKHPWVRFWFHTAFLILNRSKMSRSDGSFLTLSSLEEDMGFHPLDYRYFVLGASYHSQLNFSAEAMSSARSARLHLVELIETLLAYHPADRLGTITTRAIQAFSDALADDLNSPKALSELWAVMKNNSIDPSEKLTVLKRMDEVLGLGLYEQVSDNKDLADTDLDTEIKNLIEERNTARKNGNYAYADGIRNRLVEQGIILVDGPDGTHWKKKKL